MFTFLVETGEGLAGATSYVAVADADDYYTIDPGFAATWVTLDTAEKQFKLSWATRILDQKTAWNGIKSTETQGLRWPRKYVYDRDSLLIAEDVIPAQLKEATLELAKWLQSNDPTTGQDVDYLSRLRVDVIEIEYQEDTSQLSFPSILNNIIGSLGSFSTGGGHRFGRIVKA